MPSQLLGMGIEAGASPLCDQPFLVRQKLWWLSLQYRNDIPGNRHPDPRDGLNGYAPDMGTADKIVQLDERRLHRRLRVKDVEGRAGDLAFLQGPIKRLLVDDSATGGIDQDRGLLHGAQFTIADEAPRFRIERQMEGD